MQKKRGYMIKRKNVLELCDVLEQKSAVIFDMDGLIFDTERLFMEQLAVVMKEHGYSLDRKTYCMTLGLGGKQLRDTMCTFFGTDYPFEKISEEADKRTMMIADTVGLCVKPHIRQVLQFLQQKCIPCTVASSTQTNTVEHYLEKAGLIGFFQVIVGGEQVEQSKPAPDIFLKACEMLSKEPKHSIVLEDSENGIRAAHSAGCEVICIPDLKQPSDDVLPYITYLCCE